MQPKFSIIIPVYNTEQFLPKCLDSCINQTYKNFEIIVVNDGSPDNSEEIILAYQAKDHRIKYTKHESNKGLFIARETGVKEAQADYILHVDSDDYIGPDLLQTLSKYYNHFPSLMIYNTLSVKKIKTEKALWTNSGLQDYPNNTIFDALCLRSFTSWAICGKVFRRDLALKVYDELTVTENLIMAEDFLFFFAYSYLAQNTIYVPYNGYYYNLTNSSVNRTEYTIQKAQAHLDNLKIVVNRIKQFATLHQISTSLYRVLLIELAQTYLIKALEIDTQKRETLFIQIRDVFGDNILFEFIFNDVKRRDNRIYHGVEFIFSKIFPKNSRRYQILRYLLLKIFNLFK